MLFHGGIAYNVNVLCVVVLTNVWPFNCGSIRILLIDLELEGHSRQLDWLVFIDKRKP